ncbi:MAG: hypothetical protein HAW59_00755, partial [Betaproteobacteria bacterium]|nr:hypothetical protein [Betaproteobacteria bacterium]
RKTCHGESGAKNWRKILAAAAINIFLFSRKYESSTPSFPVAGIQNVGGLARCLTFAFAASSVSPFPRRRESLLSLTLDEIPAFAGMENLYV